MKNSQKYLTSLIFTVFLLIPSLSHSEVKLPQLIADGMVLQRNEPLRIWGWADPGEKIKVVFQGQTLKTQTGQNGKWEVILPAQDAGGPYKMTINQTEIQDILIGDVWVCSGQSNMELPIRRVMDLYENEIKQINNPNIRLFRSSSRDDFEQPQEDYKDGSWKSAIPENIMEFSAVAYFFASDIYHEKQIPIGLISTAIGGSPAESWVSNHNNKKFLDKWLSRKAKVDSVRKARLAEKENAQAFNFHKEVNLNDPGAGQWSRGDVDVSSWKTFALPGFWPNQDIKIQMGSVWFQKEFYVDDSLSSKEAVLRMGRIINSDSAFINGKFVGTTAYQYPPRIYNVPEGILKPGKNELMVRVICPWSKGGFVKEKPYELRIGSEIIDLTGEWKYHIGADVTPPSNPIPGHISWRPGGLFNGLISPATHLPVKGVIWYQGESNTGRAKEYEPLFKKLITDWRSRFNQPDLPFLFVQLANLGKPRKQPVESGWALLREAQRKALELPNTGMAVAFDIGEWNDIHPLNKKDVAHRLALEARRVAYNNNEIVSSGPLYEFMETDGNSIIINFSSTGSGLYTNSLLDGFQIAGKDGNFVWANAVVIAKNQVKVWNDQIKNPTIVRYAWQDNPAWANLKNKEGLPASPFNTATNLFD